MCRLAVASVLVCAALAHADGNMFALTVLVVLCAHAAFAADHVAAAERLLQRLDLKVNQRKKKKKSFSTKKKKIALLACNVRRHVRSVALLTRCAL